MSTKMNWICETCAGLSVHSEQRLRWRKKFHLEVTFKMENWKRPWMHQRTSPEQTEEQRWTSGEVNWLVIHFKRWNDYLVLIENEWEYLHQKLPKSRLKAFPKRLRKIWECFVNKIWFQKLVNSALECIPAYCAVENWGILIIDLVWA